MLGLVGALSVPAWAARLADQRWLAAATAAGWLIGLVGLWLAPDLYVGWTIVLGIAQGAGLSIAMTLIVLRAAHGPAARELSGMVQTTGYLFGAGGPLLVGAIRDWSGDWTLAMLILVVLSAVMIVAAVGAGRTRVVG